MKYSQKKTESIKSRKRKFLCFVVTVMVALSSIAPSVALADSSSYTVRYYANHDGIRKGTDDKKENPYGYETVGQGNGPEGVLWDKIDDGGADPRKVSPQIPVWNGHTFLGWFDEYGHPWFEPDEQEDKVKYTDHVSPINRDTDLFAHWSGYSVTFDPNGGSLDDGSTEPKTIKLTGDTVERPEDPTNGDLRFEDWFTDKDLNNYNNFLFDSHIEKNTTLYARWQCKVTYDGNGGNYKGDEKRILYCHPGDPAEDPGIETIFEREGYTLAGWTDETGEKVDFDKTIISGNTIFIADWKLNNYKVKFD
ncbi:MAG: InlB B-repeat-containing protein, partial [Lachnospiraceae bacterium]|nr:InlB B-repeat-containing protein [Lachnospiraceae bacterium]